MRCQVGVNRRDEMVEIIGGVMTPAIDDESRRSVHAAAETSHEIGADLGSEGAVLQRFLQSVFRQS